MAVYKVEICGVNTSKLPLLTNEEKEELFESEAISLGLSPDEINAVMLRYKEAVAQCHIPDAREDDTERYKKQLAEAYAC